MPWAPWECRSDSLKKQRNCIVFLTIGVSHLLFPLLHVSKIIDDGFGEVLQSPQLDLKGLQLLHLGNLERQNRSAAAEKTAERKKNYSFAAIMQSVQQVSLLCSYGVWSCLLYSHGPTSHICLKKPHTPG